MSLRCPQAPPGTRVAWITEGSQDTSPWGTRCSVTSPSPAREGQWRCHPLEWLPGPRPDGHCTPFRSVEISLCHTSCPDENKPDQVENWLYKSRDFGFLKRLTGEYKFWKSIWYSKKQCYGNIIQKYRIVQLFKNAVSQQRLSMVLKCMGNTWFHEANMTRRTP